MSQHVPMKAYSEDLPNKILEALRGTNKREATRLSGMNPSSVRLYRKVANEGRTLAPEENLGKPPKIDVALLEADLDARLAAPLLERHEFIEKVVRVEISESTDSGLLKRFGWSRKKRL